MSKDGELLGCVPSRLCVPGKACSSGDLPRPTSARRVPKPVKPSVFAPFQVVSFRFQWPADLLNSWAFEMETLILGWFILVETGSVLALTIFASLQFLGTLIAPMLGVLGDRLGRRSVLCVMRAMYACLAATLLSFAWGGSLTSTHVFAISFFAGLIRPSDLVMRNGLIGDTMPIPRSRPAAGNASCLG